jgi:hypothetical protein
MGAGTATTLTKLTTQHLVQAAAANTAYSQAQTGAHCKPAAVQCELVLLHLGPLVPGWWVAACVEGRLQPTQPAPQ